MTEPTTHTGGCHCGKVRYQTQVDLGGTVIACNCSICGKTGGLLTFVPAAAFTLLSGADVLTDYQFNRKSVHHLFCSVCGIRSFARGAKPDGTEMVMINARCLDDVDAQALTVQHFDGKKL